MGLRRWHFAVVLCLSLLGLSWTTPSALAIGKPLPKTDVVKQDQVQDIRGEPNDITITVLEKGVKPPVKGEPFVVPTSTTETDSVLGIVNKRKPLGEGRLAVYSRPATLDQAYSEFVTELGGKTLGQLDPNPHASSLSQLLPLKCKRGGKPEAIKAKADLSSLKPTFFLSLRKRELYFTLAGKPKFELELTHSGELTCEYVGNLAFVVPIATTPFVLTVKPALSATVSAEVSGSLVWTPSVTLGMRAAAKTATSIHTFDKRPPTFDGVNGQADAELFLGANIGLSLAGRAGVAGEVGPKATAHLEVGGSEPCGEAHGVLRTKLSVFVNAIFASRELTVGERDFPLHTFWKRDCAQP